MTGQAFNITEYQNKPEQILKKNNPSSLPFGKWTHNLWMITDECRVDTLNLKEISHQLQEQNSDDEFGKNINN